MRFVFVLLLALILPSPALAAWHKAVSDHFVVYGDMEPAKLRGFVERVEKFDAVLRALTGQTEEVPPNKLIIFVVPNVQALQKLKGRGARDVYGWYSPNITGAYAVVPARTGGGEYSLDAQAVLFHEYAHHFMLQYFAIGYPAWYVEGFAEFYSTTDFLKDGKVAVGMPAKFRFASLVLGTPFPLKRMFAADVGQMSGEQTSSFYAKAWLLTHYLRFDETRKGQLGTYLKSFATGERPLEAAQRAFGDLELLQKNLNDYARAGRMKYTTISGLALKLGSIAIVPLTPSEGALMPLYIRFMEGHDQAEVARFVIDARAMAKAYPMEPRAQEALAEGELDAENLAAATTANDALLRLRPGDSRALLRRARIAAAQMYKSKDFAGGWKAVRQLVVKANRAFPDDPFPLVGYFDTYKQEGVAVPDLAVDGLYRALDLAPQASDLRLMLARHLVEAKKLDKVGEVLAPILNAPHSPSLREEARALSEGRIPKPPAADTAK